MKLNRTIAAFDKALKDIMTSEEIDRVIKNAKGKEKRHLKQLKEAYKDGVVIPIWAYLHAINSPMLYKDIITFMVSKDNETVEY